MRTNSESPQFLDFSLRNSQFKAAENADEVEHLAIRMGASPFEEGIRNERISGELIDEERGKDDERWSKNDSDFETATAAVAEEITRRKQIMGDAYPFALEDSSLTYKPSKTHIYEFCLAVATAPHLSKGEYRHLPRAFERITCDAIAHYLGTPHCLRTGWPFDDGAKRARHMAEKLHKLSGEWNWAPQGELPTDPDPKDCKDLGKDVVIWKPFPDNRPGSLHFVGQCACGKSDWRSKNADIDEGILELWYRPTSWVKYVKFLAIPFHIPNHVDLKLLSTSAGLTLDRARLVLLTSDKKFQRRRSAKTNLKSLSRLVFTRS